MKITVPKPKVLSLFIGVFLMSQSSYANLLCQRLLSEGAERFEGFTIDKVERTPRPVVTLTGIQVMSAEQAAAATQKKPVEEFATVTRGEVLVSREDSQSENPKDYTYEDGNKLNVEEQEAFLSLFDWQKFTQRPNAERRTRFAIIDGTARDPELVDTVSVSASGRIGMSDTTYTPGHQHLAIKLKMNGTQLRKLMELVEKHHLSQHGITEEALHSHTSKYRELDYAAFRGYPRGMYEQGAYFEFVEKTPLRHRVLDLQVSEVGKEGWLDVARSESAVGVVDHPEKAPPAFLVFEPDPSKVYEVTLSGGPTIIPLGAYKSGSPTLNNYDTNRAELVRFFMNSVLPLVAR